jgi:hypothetical protein
MNPLARPTKFSDSSVAFEENELLDALPLDVGRSGCWCDTPEFSKPPSSSELLLLGAFASKLSLSQLNSGNPAHLRALITGCLLRNEYSVRLIITHLKQVVM